MGRPRKKHQMIQTRAQVEARIMKIINEELSKDNYLDPSKPANNAYSLLVQKGLNEWLIKRLGFTEVKRRLDEA